MYPSPRLRLLFLLVLTGACGDDSAFPGAEILDPGHGPPNAAPLEPLVPGTVRLGAVVDPPLLRDGGEEIRIRTGRDRGRYADVVTLRRKDGALYLVATVANGRLPRPLLWLPREVRDGMQWEADPFDEGAPRYRFTVRDLGVVPTPFGQVRSWDVTFDDLAVDDDALDGAPAISSYAEGFGLYARGGDWLTGTVTPLDPSDLSALAPGPTLTPVLVGTFEGLGQLYATIGMLSLPSGSFFTAHADGRDALTANPASPPPDHCRPVPGLPGDFGQAQPAAARTNGACPITRVCVPDITFGQVCRDTLQSAATGATVHGAEVLWLPQQLDVPSNDELLGYLNGAYHTTLAITDADGGADAGDLPEGLYTFAGRTYAGQPPLFGGTWDPADVGVANHLVAIAPRDITKERARLLPTRVGDTPLLVAADHESHAWVLPLEGQVGPAALQPWLLGPLSVHAHEGGHEILGIDLDGHLTEWTLTADGFRPRHLADIVLPAGNLPIHAFRHEGDLIVLSMTPSDAVLWPPGSIWRIDGFEDIDAQSDACPELPASAVRMTTVNDRGDVVICWPGRYGIMDAELDGEPASLVVSFEQGGPCALLVRSTAAATPTTALRATLPEIGPIVAVAAARRDTPQVRFGAPIAGDRWATPTGIVGPHGSQLVAPAGIPSLEAYLVGGATEGTTDHGGGGMWLWRSYIPSISEGISRFELVLVNDETRVVRGLPQDLQERAEWFAVEGGGVWTGANGTAEGPWTRVTPDGHVTTVPFPTGLEQMSLLGMRADETLLGIGYNGSELVNFRALNGVIEASAPATLEVPGRWSRDGRLVFSDRSSSEPIRILDPSTLAVTVLELETWHTVLRTGFGGELWGYQLDGDGITVTSAGLIDAAGIHPVQVPPGSLHGPLAAASFVFWPGSKATWVPR